jgi:Lrp/AsnC family transcriptional regulator, leucine-responsive regulatory protein
MRGIKFQSMDDIDQFDKAILRQLQTDATLSNQELARRVHVSPATCLRRVQRLRETGLLARQVALLDPARLRQVQAQGLSAIVEVTLDRQGAEELQAWEDHIVAFAEVQQCYRVSSGPDFVLIVYALDMDRYQQWVQKALTSASHIRNVRTFFSQHRAKFEPAYPVE